MVLPQWAVEGLLGLCKEAIAMEELTQQMGKPSHPAAHRCEDKDWVASQAPLCQIPWAQVWVYPCVVACLQGHWKKVPGAFTVLRPWPVRPAALLSRRGWSPSRAHPPSRVLLFRPEKDRAAATTQFIKPIKSQVHELEGFLA